jgi:hypothetical protein
MPQVVFDATAQKQQQKQRQLQEDLQQLKAAASDAVPADNADAIVEPNVPGQTETNMINQTVRESEAKSQPGLYRTPAEYSEVLRNAPPAHNPFAAFVPQPDNIQFETQHAQEKVLLVLRQHPVVNLGWILITVLLLVAPILLVPMLPFFSFLPSKFTFFAMIAWYMFVLTYVIEQFLGWYYNIYVITDERVIDIDFYSLIYKEVSEAQIDKIEDITATTAGILGAIFNFGHIYIQTAGEQNRFDFLSVPQPAKVMKFLNELQVEEEQEKLDGRAI